MPGGGFWGGYGVPFEGVMARESGRIGGNRSKTTPGSVSNQGVMNMAIPRFGQQGMVRPGVPGQQPQTGVQPPQPPLPQAGAKGTVNSVGVVNPGMYKTNPFMGGGMGQGLGGMVRRRGKIGAGAMAPPVHYQSQQGDQVGNPDASYSDQMNDTGLIGGGGNS